MFHCFIHYKKKLDDNTVIDEEFHISAKTEQDIKNMEAVISELLNRLDIEHSSHFMHETAIFYQEGAEE